MFVAISKFAQSSVLHEAKKHFLKITRSRNLELITKLSYFSGKEKRIDNWNKTVNAAEKVIGFPVSFMSLRHLLNDEISNIAMHLKRLVGTNHPLLRTIKQIISDGSSNRQTKGLIVLLVSKMAAVPSDINTDIIAQKQRKLAEITEILSTAFLIHKRFVDIDAFSTVSPSDEEIGDHTGEQSLKLNHLSDMNWGNKLTTLCGDYLIVSAAKLLASLENPTVVEVMSKTIRDFAQSEFIVNSDNHGNPVPDENTTIEKWRQRTELSIGSLLARSCQASLILAGCEKQLSDKAFKFGMDVAFAYQIQSELLPFIVGQNEIPVTQISLCSLPVIIELKRNKGMLQYITSYKDTLDSLDFSRIHNEVCNEQTLNETKLVLSGYCKSASEQLQQFPVSDSRRALESVTLALQNFST